MEEKKEELKKLKIKNKIYIGSIIVCIFLIIAIIIYTLNYPINQTDGSCWAEQQSEKDRYNSYFDQYTGDNGNRNDVIALINNVIKSNNENINQNGKFVEIEVDETIKDRLEIDFENEKPFGTAGTSENNQEYVENVSKNLEILKKSINSGHKYSIEVEYSKGYICKILLKDITAGENSNINY